MKTTKKPPSDDRSHSGDNSTSSRTAAKRRTDSALSEKSEKTGKQERPHFTNPIPGPDFFRERRQSAPKPYTPVDITNSLRKGALQNQSTTASNIAVAREMRKPAGIISIASENGSEKTPSYVDILERSLDLVPISLEVAGNQKNVDHGDFKVITSQEVQRVLESTFSTQLKDAKPYLESIKSEDLSRLWSKGSEYRRFYDFVTNLAKSESICTYWKDVDGVVRTKKSSTFSRAKIAKKVDFDKGNEAQSPPRVAAADTSLMNPACSLALLCLTRGDHENFARVIASNPETIISGLLNSQTCGNGRIFSDQNIWRIIGYSLPRLFEKGGAFGWAIEAISEAVARYLTFHDPQSSQGPYNKMTKKVYEGGPLGADSLVNDVSAFCDTIERLWTRLAPATVPESNILERKKEERNLDNALAAFLINITYSGVNLHLTEVISRQKAQKERISLTVKKIAGAVKGASNAIPLAGSAVKESVVEPISDTLATQAEEKIVSVNKNSSPEELKKHYAALYKSIAGNNSTSGRFVVSQKVLLRADILGMSSAAARTKPDPEEVLSSTGSASSRRRAMEIRLKSQNIQIDQKKFQKIVQLRQASGEEFREELIAVTNQNRHSIPLS